MVSTASRARLNTYQTLTALRVDQETVGLDDLLRRIKWREQLGFLETALDAVFIRREAQRRGITVSSVELQQAADEFRIARKLTDAARTDHWLLTHYLTRSDWELMLEEEVLTRKVRDVVTAHKINPYFSERRLSFDAAEISQIIVADEDIARELYAQIVEEGVYFYALARRYSLDAATRPAGGYSGLVKRDAMEAAMEAAVFGAQVGAILGPIETNAGWRLIRVESFHPAQLTDALRTDIQATLFAEWLTDQRRRAQITPTLLVPEQE